MSSAEDRAANSVDATSLTEVVAIDGPSGAGKSTVARRVAAALGFAYLDTGAMYRAVTYHFLQRGLTSFEDAAAVAVALADLRLTRSAEGGLAIDAVVVDDHLRTREVEALVSEVAALAAVRYEMVALQRSFATAGPVAAEGRDMATVVFPAARWPFYVDASPMERARRRHADMSAKGREVTVEEVLAEITARDEFDSSRAESPLRRDPRAIYIDTSGMSIDEVVAELCRIVHGGRVADGGEAGA